MADRTPSEIARDTLKMLAVRKLVPSPDNYQALYDEISGVRSTGFPEAPFRAILRVLPGQTLPQKRLLGLLESAINAHDWSAIQGVMVGYANLGLAPAAGVQHAAAHTPPPEPQLPDELAEQLARLIDNTLPALGEDDARVHELAAQLVQFLRQPAPPHIDLPAHAQQLQLPAVVRDRGPGSHPLQSADAAAHGV